MLVRAVGKVVPDATVLPFGIDAILDDGARYFWSVADVFPPLDLLVEYALYYLGFSLLLVVLRFIHVLR